MANPYVQIALEESPRYENAPVITPFRVSSNVVYLPTTGASLAPNPDYLTRADELRSLSGEPTRLIQAHAPGGSIAFRGYPDLLTWMLACAGWNGTVQAGTGTSQVTTITPGAYTATGGTFTITVAGTPTAAIPFNANAEQVQAALSLLPGVEADEIIVTGGPISSGATRFTLTFRGGMGARLLVITSSGASLTGPNSPYTLTPANTTAGVNGLADPVEAGKFLATGSFLWTFTKRPGATAQTMQMLFGRPGESVWEKGQGMGVSSMSLSAAGEASVDLTGLTYGTIPNPGLTPSYPSSLIPPVMLGDIKLTSGLAGTGRSSDFSMSITNPIDRFRDLAIESKYPARIEATGDPVASGGEITKDALTDVDVDALVNGSPFSLDARWRVRYQIAASGTYYKVYYKAPRAMYVGGDMDPMREARRFGGRFNWQAMIDESAGFDARWYLINGTPAIATWA